MPPCKFHQSARRNRSHSLQLLFCDLETDTLDLGGNFEVSSWDEVLILMRLWIVTYEFDLRHLSVWLFRFLTPFANIVIFVKPFIAIQIYNKTQKKLIEVEKLVDYSY